MQISEAHFHIWYDKFKAKPPFPDCRLGQGFVNEFAEGPHPELFYTEDEKEALKIIYETYIIPID